MGTFRFTGTYLMLLLLCLTYPLTLQAKDLINCDIQAGACRQGIAGKTLQLNILPKPVKAMEDLLFRVRLQDPGLLQGPPVIDLGMPGMHMGPNQVPLEEVEPGMYEGKGVIVRCPSGKTVWRARIDLPGLGVAEFIFDVVY